MHRKVSTLQPASETPELSELAAMETALDFASTPDCLNTFSDDGMLRPTLLYKKNRIQRPLNASSRSLLHSFLCRQLLIVLRLNYIPNQDSQAPKACNRLFRHPSLEPWTSVLNGRKTSARLEKNSAAAKKSPAPAVKGRRFAWLAKQWTESSRSHTSRAEIDIQQGRGVLSST